ncbi:glycosyltransferase [Hyphomonas sp.]|uniref:glycosyltransferase n=1 Tax=Hyphomonas sp. TaxID=87 RepID=UPI00391B3C59
MTDTTRPTDMPRPVMDILVQRQLDNMATGNCAYLETFLRMVTAAGMDVRLVFAPFQSFGNRPWAEIHPRLEALVREIEWPASVRIGKRYWSVSPRVWMRFALRILKEVWRRAGGKLTIASYLGREIAPGEARRLAALCDRRPADITLAEYSSMGPALKLMRARTIHACLMHDLLSDRAARFRAGGQLIDFDETSLETELGWLSSCELIFFASVNELETLRPHLPAARMAWVAPDAPEYGPIEDSPAPRVVFIGTVHGGNTEALNHFLDDVWPGIAAEEPGLELHIAGSIGKTLTPQRAGLPGVKVLGRVEHLESLGGANAIGIAPTRFATGVSIKVAEYLLLGMPCAAYPLALEGFGPVLDDLVVVADGPDALKAEILALARDPARRAALSAKAKAEARSRLSHAEPIRAIHEMLSGRK